MKQFYSGRTVHSAFKKPIKAIACYSAFDNPKRALSIRITLTLIAHFMLIDSAANPGFYLTGLCRETATHMAPPSQLLLPDSSVKALISQNRSSSSPTTSIDSPTDPSLPASSPPPQHPAHVCNPQLNLSIPSSSSSFSLVREITPVPENNGTRQRQKKKKKQTHGHKREEKAGKSGHADEERSKQVRPHTSREAFPDHHRKKKGCQDNACCKCASGFAADCAAICCCPLALLHLAALTFIRLPTAMAWKMLVNLKNRICLKRPLTKDGEEDSPRPKSMTPWSYGGSPEAVFSNPAAHDERFDSQNLWEHFEAGNLDFGGLSMRRDPF